MKAMQNLFREKFKQALNDTFFLFNFHLFQICDFRYIFHVQYLS